MEFFAANGIRPVRLSEDTRRFAYESVNHRYGKETWEYPAVSMDHMDGFDKLSDIDKYDRIIERIAKAAPIRICDGEKISGAATLGYAITHNVPATFGGNLIFGSVSHLTIDFETVVRCGVDHIQHCAEDAFKKHKGTERERFAKSCLNCLDYFRIWHGRYLDALSTLPEYKDNYEALKNVPFAPAKSFAQALQSIWFVFAFNRLCGNWPGIGRIDMLLGDYLEKDLKDGVITLSEARELLAHFFIKGCEWICGGDYGSGDAQHYQNILLAGIDENGNEIEPEIPHEHIVLFEGTYYYIDDNQSKMFTVNPENYKAVPFEISAENIKLSSAGDESFGGKSCRFERYTTSAGDITFYFESTVLCGMKIEQGETVVLEKFA